jgi:hypothetical protein
MEVWRRADGGSGRSPDGVGRGGAARGEEDLRCGRGGGGKGCEAEWGDVEKRVNGSPR